MKVPPPKTCSTCAHRVGSFANYGRCALSGLFIDIERKYPMRCGSNFGGWQPRQGIVTRFIQFFKGVQP